MTLDLSQLVIVDFFCVLQRNHPKEMMVFMINTVKQEIPIDESLKKKLEFICDFCNTTPTFMNGSIRKIVSYLFFLVR